MPVPPSESWGFIGLGEMGLPMAARLLSRGHGVVAYDRDPARVEAIAARGAAGARSVAEAAAASVVSVCVRDAAQLEAVLDDGMEDAAGAETTVLVHSTVGPAACRAVAARLARRGATVVDAPISGMRPAADAGTLTFFLGGPEDLPAAVQAGLAAMGGTVLHVGDVGAGQVVKIANNFVAFGTAGLILEVAAVAADAGLDEQRLVDALRHGSARSWVAEHWRFLREEWPASQPGGRQAIRAIVEKDLRLAAAMAHDSGADAPFAHHAITAVPASLVAPR